MANPIATFHDAATGETVTREMTEEEYADLLKSGWTEEEVTSEE